MLRVNISFNPGAIHAMTTVILIEDTADVVTRTNYISTDSVVPANGVSAPHADAVAHATVQVNTATVTQTDHIQTLTSAVEIESAARSSCETSICAARTDADYPFEMFPECSNPDIRKCGCRLCAEELAKASNKSVGSFEFLRRRACLVQ